MSLCFCLRSCCSICAYVLSAFICASVPVCYVINSFKCNNLQGTAVKVWSNSCDFYCANYCVPCYFFLACFRVCVCVCVLMPLTWQGLQLTFLYGHIYWDKSGTFTRWTLVLMLINVHCPLFLKKPPKYAMFIEHTCQNNNVFKQIYPATLQCYF